MDVAINASMFSIYLLRRHKTKAIDHNELRKIFESNKLTTLKEVDRLP